MWNAWEGKAGKEICGLFRLVSWGVCTSDIYSYFTSRWFVKMHRSSCRWSWQMFTSLPSTYIITNNKHDQIPQILSLKIVATWSNDIFPILPGRKVGHAFFQVSAQEERTESRSVGQVVILMGGPNPSNHRADVRALQVPGETTKLSYTGIPPSATPGKKAWLRDY